MNWIRDFSWGLAFKHLKAHNFHYYLATFVQFSKTCCFVHRDTPSDSTGPNFRAAKQIFVLSSSMKLGPGLVNSILVVCKNVELHVQALHLCGFPSNLSFGIWTCKRPCPSNHNKTHIISTFIIHCSTQHMYTSHSRILLTIQLFHYILMGFQWQYASKLCIHHILFIIKTHSPIV